MQDLDRTDILNRAGIDDANVVEILPATAGQLYMISMWLNTKGGNFYPEFTYQMSGKVAFGDLQKSWESLILANPILRTCFASAGDHQVSYVQVVLRHVNTEIMEITGCGEDEIRNLLQGAISQQPWVKLLVSRNPDGWNLRLKIHHALYDGVSLPLLMQQFEDLCNGGAPSPINDILGKFLASSHSSSAVEKRKQFWTSYLQAPSETPSLPQPSGAPTTRTEIFKPSIVSTSNLEAAARKYGTSTQAIFLAIYAKQYARLQTNHTNYSVVLGIYLANRSLLIDAISSAAIPTLNLLPIRVTAPLSRDIPTVAASIQEDVQRLRDPAIACTSLFEIYNWTGIQPDTFVNFLSLPDSPSSSSQENTRGVNIKSMDQWQDSISRTSTIEQIPQHHSDVLEKMTNKSVNDVYLVSSPLLHIFLYTRRVSNKRTARN